MLIVSVGNGDCIKGQSSTRLSEEGEANRRSQQDLNKICFIVILSIAFVKYYSLLQQMYPIVETQYTRSF